MQNLDELVLKLTDEERERARKLSSYNGGRLTVLEAREMAGWIGRLLLIYETEHRTRSKDDRCSYPDCQRMRKFHESWEAVHNNAGTTVHTFQE